VWSIAVSERLMKPAMLPDPDDPSFDLYLSLEQIAEIERRAADDGPYATDEEVQEVFARLKK
jgi:hypothetical protein